MTGAACRHSRWWTTAQGHPQTTHRIQTLVHMFVLHAYATLSIHRLFRTMRICLWPIQRNGSHGSWLGTKGHEHPTIPAANTGVPRARSSVYIASRSLSTWQPKVRARTLTKCPMNAYHCDGGLSPKRYCSLLYCMAWICVMCISM